MKIDLKRLNPAFADSRKEAGWLILALVTAVGWNGIHFLLKYLRQLSRLYRVTGTRRVLLPGAQMVPFGDVIRGGGTFYPVLLIGAAALALEHYLGHYRGSKSVYLMRRLPDRWEYHRRCLAVPVLTVLAAAAAFGLQTGLHYLCYLLLTPKGCL